LPKTASKLKRQALTSPRLPLAIYREIVAHLRQVKGVNSGLISQNSPEFDYLQSQVGGLWIEYETDIQPEEEAKVNQILAYYAQKYNPWLNYDL
jgi:hypothetical protein